MKRLLVLCALFLTVFAFSACGSASSSTSSDASASAQEGQGENALLQYEEKGYSGNCGLDAYPEDEEDDSDDAIYHVRTYKTSPDRKDCVIIDIKLTKKEYDEEMESGNFYEDISPDKFSVISMKDQIPSEEEMNQYVGKTIADLEADGFEESIGEAKDDGYNRIEYENSDTGLILEISAETDSNYMDLSEKELSALTIKTVQFQGFDPDPEYYPLIKTSTVLGEYLEKGYTIVNGIGSIPGDKSHTVGICLTSKDKTDCVKITGTLTEEEYNQYFEGDEAYLYDDEKIIAELPLQNIKETSLKDQIPEEKKVNQYVGKKIADLEAEGYEQISSTQVDSEPEVEYQYEDYDTGVILVVTAKIDGDAEDALELSEEEISALTIDTCEFYGFDILN